MIDTRSIIKGVKRESTVPERVRGQSEFRKRAKNRRDWPGEARACALVSPNRASLLDAGILNGVFFPVLDEVPGDFLDNDLHERVGKGTSARSRVDGQGPPVRERAFRVAIVNVV